MEPLGYPKRTDSQRTGRIGETFVEHFITRELGWIFRPVHREDDYGIDGYADIVQGESVSSRGVAVQIKCGDSYLMKKTTGGFRYDGSNQHLNFYLNLGVPVLLLLVSGDCKEGYWCEFELGRTEQTSNGWWIEIPRENIITAEVGEKWALIAGPIQDYSTEIQEFWAFSRAIQAASALLIAIPRGDVETKSMHTINTVLERLCSNKGMLLKKRNSIELFFPDWDDDPREIYDIPEIRKWFMASFDAGVPWFYFINFQFPFNTLRILLACGCSIAEQKRSDEGYILITESKERVAWLEANLASLNHFTDSKCIDVSINKTICEGVMGALFNYPSDADPEKS
jgi:hypothetical protein